MNIIMRLMAIGAVALLPLTVAAARPDTAAVVLRPVTSAFTIGAGTAHRADTYLTPLRYHGWMLALGYNRYQAPSFAPERWLMALDVDLTVDRTLNPVRNAVMWGADVEGRWSLLRRFDMSPAVTLAAGGATTLDVGALYLSRNGNNPVAARGSWTVDLGAAAIGRCKVAGVPVVGIYRATMPVAGAFFTPDYGQLYYEMYLGDTHGVVSPAVWGRYFRLDQQITVDVRFGGTALRLGYKVNIESTRANDIVTRRIGHMAVVGVAGEWLTLSSGRRCDRESRIIQAVY